MLAKFLALYFGLTALPSALACTRAGAEEFRDYINHHLPGTSPDTVSSSSDSSTSDLSPNDSTDLIDLAREAVDDLAWKRGRRSADEFECQSTISCQNRSAFINLV